MRMLIAVIVILAVIWAIEPARQRVTAAAVPVLEALGPVGEFALRPARRMGAKSQARQITRMITIERNENREVPDARSFDRWLARRMPDDRLDPWGNVYWLDLRTNTLTVGSNGPDGVRGTDDDISHSVAF
jgi:hypothetical protein